MKVLILCGGKGMRMGEITGDIPKPLAQVGGKPILWHVMNIYLKHGFDDFILLLGYKGEKIKEYFIDEEWKEHDFILDSRGGEKTITLLEQSRKWSVTFLDTGQETMTGSRVKQAEKFIDEDTFMLTYGDGIANIDINKLLFFHNNQGRLATLTGIQTKSQYGLIEVKNNLAASFYEKPELKGNRFINGGFFVLNRKVLEYLTSDNSCVFEREPLIRLSAEKQLAVYKHTGFWTAIDTYKDLVTMNDEWVDIERHIYN